MIEQVKSKKKLISKVLGFIFILIALSLFFWNNQRTVVVTQEMRAAANVARMEAHVNRNQVSSKSSSHSATLQELKDRQKEHIQILLISMILFGIGFLVYGFIKKD